MSSESNTPIALVKGQPVNDLPKDLYIPPEALTVFLASFEGPLDLLLYLIKKENIDILDVNVFEITYQYVQYVELMEAVNFELAAEYLVMAAMLAEIKSRLLLPRQVEENEDEDDPRAALIRRLQEYEQIKQAADEINQLDRLERDFQIAKIDPPEQQREKLYEQLVVDDLLVAFADVLKKAEQFESHQVEKEKLSTRERMSDILQTLQGKAFIPLVTLFVAEEGRLGVIVTFLAVMELIKASLVDIVQTTAFGPIHVKAKLS